MTIKNGIAVLILAVLVAIGGWYLFTHSQSLPHALNENGDRQIKEDTDFYTIQAVYPNSTRLATRTDSSKAADDKAIRTIESSVNAAVSAFKTAADKALTEGEKSRLTEQHLKYSLNIAYHAYNSGSFVSYEFDVSRDVGTAPSTKSYTTLVFDLKGNQVELGDLFVSGSNYLERISAKTQDTAHFVDDQSTLIFFTALSTTSPEVRIPLDELKDILKPGIQ